MKFEIPLVNAHTHAAMIPFRGVAGDVSLDSWLNDYIWPLEKKNVSADFVSKYTKISVAAMMSVNVMRALGFNEIGGMTIDNEGEDIFTEPPCVDASTVFAGL